MTEEELRRRVAKIVIEGRVHFGNWIEFSLKKADQILNLFKSFGWLSPEEAKGIAERATKAESALEADAADLWRVTNAIKDEITARWWITEGRGGYTWDDDRYKDETRLAFEAVLKLIENVRHPAQLRFHQVINGKVELKVKQPKPLSEQKAREKAMGRLVKEDKK